MKSYSSLLEYLKRAQCPDGSFDHSPFQTSLILFFLGSLKNNTFVQIIARKGMSYLLSQPTLIRSWNYHDRNHQGPHLPDDLDDTSLVLMAISIHNPKIIDDQLLLSFVNLLIQCETQEGGPYFTWITMPQLRETWDDIDPVVNLNIHQFLNSQNIELEPLNSFLENINLDHGLISKYYSPLQIVFFLSTWKKHPQTHNLLHKLVSLYPTITTSLEKSLFAIAYCNLGGDPRNISHDMETLSHITHHEVSADPFYIEEKSEQGIIYAQSKPLTVACIVSALVKYTESIQAKNYQGDPNPITISTIEHYALHRFQHAPQKIRRRLATLIKKLSNQSKAPEIFLLPHLWNQSLGREYRKNLNRETIELLCIVNVLGWIGFSIFDSVIDGESATNDISIANLCLREMQSLLTTLAKEYPEDISIKILNMIDYATFTELKMRCVLHDHVLKLPPKLPEYKNHYSLAHKSLGHALGPILITHGTVPKKFFMNYLTARQLNDDAHDWMDDLEQGFLNPVSLQIIKRFLEINPTRKTIHLEEDRECLQSIFWNETIDTVARDIKTYTSRARTTISRTPILKDTIIQNTLLVPLENSAHEALMERDRIIKFLEEYR